MSGLTTRAYGSRSITSAKIALDTIINEVIKTDAAIAYSKLAALTASRALVSDGSGIVSPSAVTSTELGYLTGLSSNLQSQINALALGTSRRTKVINKVDPTAAPPTEVSGDRYILGNDAGTVHADWDGASKNSIVTFGGTTWSEEVPTEGWVVYADTPNYDYRFVNDGTPYWEAMNSASLYLQDGKIFIGDVTNAAVGQTLSGDVTVSNTGVTAIGSSKVTNDMLAGSIADTKLSTISTANKVSGSAVQLNADNSVTNSTGLKACKHIINSVTLAGGDITAQYVDGTQEAYATTGVTIRVKGLGPLFVGDDFTVSNVSNKVRITFTNALATGGAQELVAGDVMEIEYDYM
jgi:hypothetical protein